MENIADPFILKVTEKKVGKGCIKILSMVLRIQFENQRCHFIKTL